MAIIVQLGMELILLMFHIVFHLTMNHALRIQEAFVTTQEIHLLGVIS